MAKVLDLDKYKAGIGTSSEPWWKDTDESPKELWDKVYKDNYLNWWHPDSKSGEGTVKQAERRIGIINDIVKEYDIKTVMDIGCGDLYWATRLDFRNITRYAGLDVSSECVAQNLYKETKILEMYQCDITNPEDNRRFHFARTFTHRQKGWDLVLLFDILNHCIQSEIEEIISFLKKADVKYVLTNNFSLKRMEWENNEFENTPEETGIWWPGHWDGKTKDVRNMPVNLDLHPDWNYKKVFSDEEFHLTTSESGTQMPQGNECIELYKLND